MGERQYHLDWLRFFVVALLVPYHISLSYTGIGDAYTYHQGIRNYYLGMTGSPDFDIWYLRIFADFLSHFFMQLLFVISGFSSYFALKKRTPVQFFRERSVKLILPAITGSCILVSITSYFRNISLFGFSGSFIDFYPLYFNGIRSAESRGNFEWGHLWFLVYLYVICIITLPLIQRLRRPISKNLFPVILFCMFLFELLFRPGWPGFQNLIDDWANLSNYLLLYITGFIMAKDHTIQLSAEKNCRTFLTAGILLYLLKLSLTGLFNDTYGYNVFTLISIFARTSITLLLVFGILGWSTTNLNRNNTILKKCSLFAFPLYILHYVPVTLCTHYLLDTELSIPLQFITSVLLSYSLIMILYLIIKRIPGLRIMIGLR